MNVLIGHYNYWIVIFLMMAGLYVVIAQGNLVKKIVGVATTALALALVVRINEAYRSVEEDEIHEQDQSF